MKTNVWHVRSIRWYLRLARLPSGMGPRSVTKQKWSELSFSSPGDITSTTHRHWKHELTTEANMVTLYITVQLKHPLYPMIVTYCASFGCVQLVRELRNVAISPKSANLLARRPWNPVLHDDLSNTKGRLPSLFGLLCHLPDQDWSQERVFEHVQ